MLIWTLIAQLSIILNEMNPDHYLNYTDLISHNDHRRVGGEQNFSAEDPRGGKNVAREFRGGGQIFSTRIFQICTAPPPAINTVHTVGEPENVVPNSNKSNKVVLA